MHDTSMAVKGIDIEQEDVARLKRNVKAERVLS